MAVREDESLRKSHSGSGLSTAVLSSTSVTAALANANATSAVGRAPALDRQVRCAS